nr:gamma-glutamyltransferase family protein [Novosphingobium sp. PP1Y]
MSGGLDDPRGGIVTAPHYLASEAGLDVLRDGGTAVEACVAMAACLAVVYPHMTGIGGDGFWLIREPDGALWAIDACGRASRNVSLELYAGLDAIPMRGPLAANTVAGTVSGWQMALGEGGGGLSLDRLLGAAITHAEAGVSVTRGGAAIAGSRSDELASQPGAYARIFEPANRPMREGEVLRQPELARTFRKLVDEGLGSFYRGDLAALIAQDLQVLGSPVDGIDLAAHEAQQTVPLSAEIHGAMLYNTAPPTQGLASLLILALFDRLTIARADGFDYLHGLVEATKHAFLVRDAHLGDPAWMSLDPQGLLSSNAAIGTMLSEIRLDRAMPWPHPTHWGDTCWFGAADGRGQVVSCIQSTYFEFGSGLVLPQTGITWQNRGSGFRLADDGWNALKPGRKPFHTLNPALAVFDDGRVMAYGTMGGEGQPQTQAAIFTRYARFGVALEQAIAAPRWLLGRTWGEESTSLKLEEGFAPETIDALRRAGHEVEIVPSCNALMGHAGAIVRHPGGRLEGASDPRSDGLVAAF